MAYLISNDYLPLIQSGNLNAIQVNNPAIRAQAELAAIGEAVSILRQKYDTTTEFTNTMVWAASGPGNMPGRAPLAAIAWQGSSPAAWVAGTSYVSGNIVLQSGYIYQCTTGNSDTLFTAANWQQGPAYPYQYGALVEYTDGNIYQSMLTISNDHTPSTDATWLNLSPAGSTQYCAGDRVYLDADAWESVTTWAENTNYVTGSVVTESGDIWRCVTPNNSGLTFNSAEWVQWLQDDYYDPGDLVLYTDGNVYQCVTANADAVFNRINWNLLGVQYAFFNAAYPVPVFDFANGIYKEGDEVFWNNHIYTCIKPTLLPDHQSRLQVHEIEYLPYGNVFPDDPLNGSQWWGAGIPYVVPAGTLITDTTYWIAGDNRDQQMVQKLVDMTLFHLLSSIAPRNIPELRRNRYMGDEKDQVRQTGEVIYPVYSALGWLQACARGAVMPALPVLQPPRGNRIRYGGTVRNVNSY